MSIAPKAGDPTLDAPAVRAERGLCANCDQYPKCLFNMPRYGGFKGSGPRYVRYAIITDRVEKSNGKEDFTTCVNFVETLQDRMLSGRAASDSGRKGAEIVRLLMDDRATVTQGMQMGFNGKGEIIKAQPNQIADLEKAGYTVNRTDNTPAVEWKIVKFERTVPDYNAPKITTDTYSQEIASREEELRRQEMEEDDERWESRLADVEPNKMRRGRPPGSRNKPKADDFEEAE